MVGMFPVRILILILGHVVTNASAQTWCNKNYMKSQPIVPPGGQFPIPEVLTTPLLALRCYPALRPYLPEDATSSDQSSVSILIDAPVTFSKIVGAVPITLSTSPSTTQLVVAVSIDGKQVASGNVPLNATKHALPFSLSSLQTRKAAYNISCTASYASQKFQTTGALSYLPALPSGIGSVTKMDLRTGALLARPANGKGGPYAPILPIGFYTSFDGYLSDDLTIPAKLKAQGFNIIHAVPTFSSLTLLDTVLDKMQEAGLYLMYDMRFTYMNSSSVTTQVNHIKSRPNLLLWYTADEPDGTSDPLDATVIASNLITSLDGGDGAGGAGYHPVSLVLNCQDYEFTTYTRGTDIVMQDAYMIGNNVTFSSQWGTVCTKDYGDCGCDNCEGKFEDISTRMDQFRERLFINGWDRTKAVWTVPQGFGNDTYWKRYPTGKEFVVESILGINHGGLGVISWDDPTSADIKASASTLALSVPKMTPFILNPSASFHQITLKRIDVGLWTVGSQTLVLATNMNNVAGTVGLSDLGLGGKTQLTQVLDSGARISGAGFSFDSVGSGAFIVN